MPTLKENSLAVERICQVLSVSLPNLDSRMAEQLSRYYEEVCERNLVMNLTTITESEEFLQKHYVDSYLAYRPEWFQGVKKALDLGTGGGFPGVPFAIYTPDIEWTLLDSVAKKLNFIAESAHKLGIHNIATLHARAEDAGHNKKYREEFDMVVSRAVANLAILCEWALPLVKVGGVFLALKGLKGEEELAQAQHAITCLGGELEEVYSTSLGDDGKRTIIAIRKVSATERRFPRKPGVAQRKPL